MSDGTLLKGLEPGKECSYTTGGSLVQAIALGRSRAPEVPHHIQGSAPLHVGLGVFFRRERLSWAIRMCPCSQDIPYHCQWIVVSCPVWGEKYRTVPLARIELSRGNEVKSEVTG